MKLVIVESPAKCTTIKRYLGDEYEVVASLGHIRDLATSGKGGLGVDVEHDFAPSYIINKDKIKVVQSLTQLAKNADEVILATDPDREGEAIAWHLAQVLHLNVETTKRLEFHEITRDSISSAMANPRTIDKDLVSSQETRRILDRIIGFKLSTLMFKKIKSRSAGRVQSATLKMIKDHDEEILNFQSKEYWNILVQILLNNKEFNLTFSGKNGKTIEITNKEKADEILAALPDKLVVSDVKKTVRVKESKEPFTTSTLQQEAFAKLKFKTKKTQFLAQELYEGIDVGDEHMGLITYMRTDSTRLSPTFINRSIDYIKETYGENYVGKVKKSHLNDMSQDAHEAIRPTSNHRTPESIRKYLSTDQFNLYRLIYNRAVASLMAPKKEEVLNVVLNGGEYNFKFEIYHTTFKGFEVLYKDNEEEAEYGYTFPNIQIGDEYAVINKSGEQKFTQPPAHYSEAKVVKLMEEVGIGRPSTYASTIETLRARKYVENEAGILTVTDQGRKTAIVLNKYFPDIVNVKYTAQMEAKLDHIEDGDLSRSKLLNSFYGQFMKEWEVANENIYIDEPIPTGELCPKCGAPLIYKDGKNGEFVGCSNYPKCNYIVKKEKEVIYTGESCPLCGKPLVERTSKTGKKFVGCSGYPECKYIKAEKTEDDQNQAMICPECGGYLVKKKGKHGYFLGCSNYPKCNHMEKIYRKKGK